MTVYDNAIAYFAENPDRKLYSRERPFFFKIQDKIFVETDYLGEGAHGTVFSITEYPVTQTSITYACKQEDNPDPSFEVQATLIMGYLVDAFKKNTSTFLIMKYLPKINFTDWLLCLPAEILTNAKNRLSLNVPNLFLSDLGKNILQISIGCGLKQGDSSSAPFTKTTFWLMYLKLINQLLFAHEHNIAHRDVKPNNIQIDPQNHTAYLIDWGLSYIAQPPENLAMGIPGRVFGTASYLPPEVKPVCIRKNKSWEQNWDPSAKLTTKVDAYMLGQTMAEAFFVMNYTDTQAPTLEQTQQFFAQALAPDPEIRSSLFEQRTTIIQLLLPSIQPTNTPDLDISTLPNPVFWQSMRFAVQHLMHNHQKGIIHGNITTDSFYLCRENPEQSAMIHYRFFGYIADNPMVDARSFNNLPKNWVQRDLKNCIGVITQLCAKRGENTTPLSQLEALRHKPSITHAELESVLAVMCDTVILGEPIKTLRFSLPASTPTETPSDAALSKKPRIS